MFNIERKEGFKQVCVIPGCVVTKSDDPSTPEEFEQFMMETFEVKTQYLEEIITLPDSQNGNIVKGTGGRTDLFFAVHDEDIKKFSVPRFKMGIRWVEDVLAKGNYRSKIYPRRVFKYKTWGIEKNE